MTAVEVGGYGESRLSGRGADEVEDFLVGIERFAGPVFGDFGKQAVLDGIPFGGARGVVCDSHREAKGIGELGLQFGFPGTDAGSVAAAGVGQDQEFA